MYVLSASDKRVSVQFVGKDLIKDKLSRFEELTSVSLSYMGVSSLGNPGQIGSVLPSKFLDRNKVYICLHWFKYLVDFQDTVNMQTCPLCIFFKIKNIVLNQSNKRLRSDIWSWSFFFECTTFLFYYFIFLVKMYNWQLLLGLLLIIIFVMQSLFNYQFRLEVFCCC